MNLLIPKKYGYSFASNILYKYIRDVRAKIAFIDFDLLDIWIRVEYGLEESITCRKIIIYSLDKLEIVELNNHYMLRFNPTLRYPSTTIKLITLLNTITYGTRHFKGNAVLLNEFKELNTKLNTIYNMYSMLGVVI